MFLFCFHWVLWLQIEAFDIIHASNPRFHSFGNIIVSLVTSAWIFHVSVVICYYTDMNGEYCTCKTTLILSSEPHFIYTNQNNCCSIVAQPKEITLNISDPTLWYSQKSIRLELPRVIITPYHTRFSSIIIWSQALMDLLFKMFRHDSSTCSKSALWHGFHIPFSKAYTATTFTCILCIYIYIYIHVCTKSPNYY